MRTIPPVNTEEIAGEVLAFLDSEREVSWLGINSFEDRCLGSIHRLHDQAMRMGHLAFLDYSTVAYPEVDDQIIRRKHRDSIGALAHLGKSHLVSKTIDAYASEGFEATVKQFAKLAEGSILVLDITCMTKIHVVALANVLKELADLSPRILLVYTSPRAYGNLDKSSREIGWRDVIIAPVASAANMRNESHSRGIVIAGHESERVWSAMNEIEPAGGILTLGKIPKRPDITLLSERINKKVIDHMAIGTSSEWKRQVVDVADVVLMDELVRHEVALARAHKAPVILYPFGPKSLVCAASIALLTHYASDSWFVYPVPPAYDVTYSEGIGGSYWFAVV